MIAKGEKYYIRFGEIPEDFRSKVHRSDAILAIEDAVSVWDSAMANDEYFPILPDSPNEACIQDYFNCLFGNKPAYLVIGTELSTKGYDGEPLLDKDIEIIREITHYEYLKSILRR